MRVSRKVLIPAALAAACGLAACSSSSQAGGSPTSTRPPASSASPTGTGSPTAAPHHTPSPTASAPHATEFNPPGDIPDNQVFIDYRYPGSKVHLRFPEGWARSSRAGTTTFTDHFNSISVQVVSAAQRPTPTSVQAQDVAQLRRTVAQFSQPKVSQVTRAHGPAVLLTYLLDSAPDPVTGKVVRDAAERYAFWRQGQEAILTLTGPKGADNVDPWRLVSDSLQWR
jgi:hypothetical protein